MCLTYFCWRCESSGLHGHNLEQNWPLVVFVEDELDLKKAKRWQIESRAASPLRVAGFYWKPLQVTILLEAEFSLSAVEQTVFVTPKCSAVLHSSASCLNLVLLLFCLRESVFVRISFALITFFLPKGCCAQAQHSLIFSGVSEPVLVIRFLYAAALRSFLQE